MALSAEEVSELDDTPLNQWVKTVSDDPGIQKLLFEYYRLELMTDKQEERTKRN